MDFPAPAGPSMAMIGRRWRRIRLSIKRVEPTWAAIANKPTSSILATGVKVSGCTSATYSTLTAGMVDNLVLTISNKTELALSPLAKAIFASCKLAPRISAWDFCSGVRY